MLKVKINSKAFTSKFQSLPARWVELFNRASRTPAAKALIPEEEIRNLPGLKKDMLRAMGLVDDAARIAPLKKATSAKIVEFFSSRIFKK